MADSNSLSDAASAYRDTFGHNVPTEVLQLFAQRPGPLVMEIRQALALHKPVPAWLARSRLPMTSPPPNWSSGM